MSSHSKNGEERGRERAKKSAKMLDRLNIIDTAPCTVALTNERRAGWQAGSQLLSLIPS